MSVACITMCGRYASTRSADDLATIFEATNATGDESLAASYNVAPTNRVHVVRLELARPGSDAEVSSFQDASSFQAERLIQVARWGLLPPWARHPREGARMINARAETVTTSRAYRVPFARRRCLVPADGWYEWRADSQGKQPYYLTPRNGDVLAFAGLWEVWGPERVMTVTIVTTAARGELAEIHHRMPLVLSPDRWEEWLDVSGSVPPDRLLAPPADDWLADIEIRPVGRAVGDVRNNSPELIQPVTDSLLTVDRAEPADLTLF